MLMKEDATFEYRCSPVVVYWRLGTSCLSSYLGDMLWPPDDGSDRFHISGNFPLAPSGSGSARTRVGGHQIPVNRSMSEPGQQKPPR